MHLLRLAEDDLKAGDVGVVERRVQEEAAKVVVRKLFVSLLCVWLGHLEREQRCSSGQSPSQGISQEERPLEVSHSCPPAQPSAGHSRPSPQWMSSVQPCASSAVRARRGSQRLTGGIVVLADILAALKPVLPRNFEAGGPADGVVIGTAECERRRHCHLRGRCARCNDS